MANGRVKLEIESKYLADGLGKKSSMRIVWASCTSFVFLVWGVISIKQWALAAIDPTIAVLLLGMWGGKVTQKWLENGSKK